MKARKTMIKDIVVNLSVGATRDVATDFAVSVASTLDAHLAGVAFAYEPVMPGTIFDGVSASIVAAYRSEREQLAKTAIEKFEAAAKRGGVSAESRLLPAGLADAAGIFSRLARCYDLTIIAQAKPDTMAPEELLTEAALFGSGRPVLVVPYIQTTGLKLDRVIVCWDGSRNAARAIADAMPLLERAKTIEVVTIATKERRNEMAGADIAQHLARHGLKVDLENIVAKDIDVTNTILSHVADASADLIVMGGYGHSRLREFMLGGATRGILTAMTVPTLMSH
jgi:nucleotide-binding universal stress UspA family protein